MAILTIIQKKRKFTPMLPHKILIGGQFIGLMRTPSVRIDIPQGLYEVTIQSIFRHTCKSMGLKFAEMS